MDDEKKDFDFSNEEIEISNSAINQFLQNMKINPLNENEKEQFEHILEKYLFYELEKIKEMHLDKNKAMFLLSMIDFFERGMNFEYDDGKITDEIKEKIANYSTPRVGDIRYANLMVSFPGELGFIHPVLVLEVDKKTKSFFCVPATSKNIKTAYYPNGNQRRNEMSHYLIKTNDGNGKYVKKDSVFLLKQSRVLSFSRLTPDNYIGKIEENTNIFHIIKELVLRYTYRDASLKVIFYDKAIQNIEDIKDAIKKNKESN